MDNEILETIIAKVGEVRVLLDVVVDASSNAETTMSEKTGKEIAIDFDDMDLTNLQMSVDEAAQLLQDLSGSIAAYL